MSSLKLFSIIIVLIVIIKQNECQRLENNIPGAGILNATQEVPFFGQCDRIAMKGVLDCLENFLPNRIFFGDNSGGMCCAYSKYKACTLGLNDGLKKAMDRAKCPRSYASQIIMAFSENVVGFPMKILCDRSDGRDQCPPPNQRRNSQNI